MYYLLWICGEFEKTSGTIALLPSIAKLLPSIANYCHLLPTIVNYCLLLPTIGSYCLLLPTFFCQLETLVWERYTPCGSVPERLLYKFPTVHFEINPLFSSTILCIYICIIPLIIMTMMIMI